jgi:L-2,4-diaminobutyrate decarboxylase
MTPQERIAAAYSPARFEEYAVALSRLLGEHLAAVQSRQGPVLNWNEPLDNIAAAGAILDQANSPPTREGFESLVKTILSRGQNLHHPRYIGHQVPASSPLAALFDFIGAATNQVMAIYEMGPWASAVERSLVDRLGERFGLPRGRFAGLVTSGGSLANLTALLTARNVSLAGAWESGVARPGRPPVIVAQSDAHYCIARSAGILGLGTQHILRVPLDARRRMDPAALDQMLTNLRAVGQPVVAVVACSGATPTGAFDPLEPIADICERQRVWLHVDAAHGGAAVFSDEHRPLLAGLDRADSFICDAHKLLFVPALCAFVFYRDREHRFQAFRQDAPYLFDPSAPGSQAEYDTGLLTVECTKRAAAFGLWGLWALFGPQLFSDCVDNAFARAREFWERLREASDFVPLHEPQCNIVCFRYVPPRLRDAPLSEIGRFNQMLRVELIRSGEYYIVQTNLDGAPALRLTVMNPLTTAEDLDGLLEAIRAAGARVESRGAAAHAAAASRP